MIWFHIYTFRQKNYILHLKSYQCNHHLHWKNTDIFLWSSHWYTFLVFITLTPNFMKIVPDSNLRWTNYQIVSNFFCSLHKKSSVTMKQQWISMIPKQGLNIFARPHKGIKNCFKNQRTLKKNVHKREKDRRVEYFLKGWSEGLK